LVTESLKKGVFPLWNPYNFSGAPLLANYQSQVFYPLTFLYFIMPQSSAWTIMVLLQPILGSVFLYLFATEIGLTTAAAMLAALLFNFSSFANVWMEFTTVWHTILWLPLLLYLVERGVKQKGLSFGQQILFIFGLFSAITGGHPQDFINSFIVLFIYTAVRTWKFREWPRTQLLFIFCIPFFLAAPQLFPTIELFRHSARVAHDYKGIIENMLVQWWQVPLVAVQDLFGNPATKSNITGDYVGKTLSVGFVGFFFAVAAILNKYKSWHKTFFTWTGIVILLITVRTPVTELLYRYPWPVLSTGTPTRNLFILALALSILAGFGYDAIRKTKTFPYKTVIVNGTVLAIIWLFAYIHPPVATRAIIIATGVLAATATILFISRYKRIFLLVIIPLAAAELLYGFIKFNPFVSKEFVYPENKLISQLQKITGIDRYWGYGTAGIEANFATEERIFSADGTDPLNLSWYNQFLQSSNEGNIAVTFNRTTRSDAQIQPGYGRRDLPTNEFRLRIMDLLGVKYVIDRSENPKDNGTFPVDRFKPIWHAEDWTIYKNLMVAPRFFLTSDVRPYKNTADFEIQFFAADFNPGKTVLLALRDWNTIPHLTGNGSAKLVSYTPNQVTITVQTDSEQLLFISDTYDNGWTARVDGRTAKVFKADFAFRAVLVPKGESTVIISYEPRSFYTGIVIGSITFFFLVLYFARAIWRRKRQ
jgi:hypothetical protein